MVTEPGSNPDLGAYQYITLLLHLLELSFFCEMKMIIGSISHKVVSHNESADEVLRWYLTEEVLVTLTKCYCGPSRDCAELRNLSAIHTEQHRVPVFMSMTANGHGKGHRHLGDSMSLLPREGKGWMVPALHSERKETLLTESTRLAL